MNRKKNIEIRYVVEGNSSPLCIRAVMSLKLYIEIKKHEVGFGTYPICIDTSDKGVALPCNCCFEFHQLGRNSLIMDCNLLNSLGQTCFPRFKVENIDGVRGNMTSYKSRIGFCRVHTLFSVPNWKLSIPCTSWKIFCAPENSLVVSEKIEDAGLSDPEQVPEQPLRTEELKLLLADAERSKLLKKLSEANRYNRLLKRELQAKEDAMVNFKSELSVTELEIQALARLAEEIAKSAIPAGSRKIKGRYIQSHLFSRLEAISEKLKEQIKGVEAVQAKEVPLSWVGVAESVQVMGSFDGWSQGEHLSPEYTGSYMNFSATLFLRPGRYEIKFLVDDEWKLSPELPTTGEGLTKNNLLVVE